jgi:hypothetical protein
MMFVINSNQNYVVMLCASIHHLVVCYCSCFCCCYRFILYMMLNDNNADIVSTYIFVYVNDDIDENDDD